MGVGETAWQLGQLSSPKAASYFWDELASMMTFATTVAGELVVSSSS